MLCEPFTQWVLEDNFADGRPPLEDAGVQLAAGRPFTRAAAVVACWARYAEGTDESGEPDEMDGALAPQLQAAAGRQGSHPEAFLEDNRAIFGWETTRGSPGCTARS